MEYKCWKLLPAFFLPEIIVWFFVRHPYNALRIATLDNLE